MLLLCIVFENTAFTISGVNMMFFKSICIMNKAFHREFMLTIFLGEAEKI